jgi:hypothetical protein
MTKLATTERRIADAVMGLESLWLRNTEDQELGYRLRYRLAAYAAAMKSDGSNTKAAINLAYSVRSSFVHGSPVSADTRKKIETKYSNLDTLLIHVLEHLRISIVTFALIDLNKDNFLSLVDGSFYQTSQRKLLTEKLRTVRRITSFHSYPSKD